MQNTEFDDFVERQQEDASRTASVDWQKERDEWVHHLAKLYSHIETLLNKYISAKQISREYRTIKLNEEYIGSYSVKQMVLKVGRQEVNIEPIGRMVIGAKGRVDVVGPTGRIQLLLVDSRATKPSDLIHVDVSVGGKGPGKPTKAPRDITWEWKMVTRPPARAFIELTQETFFQLLMEIANG